MSLSNQDIKVFVDLIVEGIVSEDKTPKSHEEAQKAITKAAGALVINLLQNINDIANADNEF